VVVNTERIGTENGNAEESRSIEIMRILWQEIERMRFANGRLEDLTAFSVGNFATGSAWQWISIRDPQKRILNG
jgi:hypothetical protein